MARARRGAPLLSLTLLAACAGEPAADDASVQAASVVRAFANICGRLDTSEVARRAGSLGFVPVDPARLPPQAAASFPRDGSLQMLVRPATSPGALTAILAWNTQGPSCELAVLGVEPAVLEREFDRMLASLSRQDGLRVQQGQINQPAAAGGLRVQRAVMMSSTQMMNAAPQIVVLRVGDGPETRLRAIMSIHVTRPQAGPGAGGAIPPPAPGRSLPR